jgi:hypothetical protein
LLYVIAQREIRKRHTERKEKRERGMLCLDRLHFPRKHAVSLHILIVVSCERAS